MAEEAKSNEIKAIPMLMELLDLQGAAVTIDAIGRQKDIARQITEQGPHCVLAFNGNHGTFHEEVSLFPDQAIEKSFPGIPCDFHARTEKMMAALKPAGVYAPRILAGLNTGGLDLA